LASSWTGLDRPAKEEPQAIERLALILWRGNLGGAASAGITAPTINAEPERTFAF